MSTLYITYDSLYGSLHVCIHATLLLVKKTSEHGQANDFLPHPHILPHPHTSSHPHTPSHTLPSPHILPSLHILPHPHTPSHPLTSSHPPTPVEHFFLSSDMWYPPPTSSRSSPDRVAPSHKNCASTGAGTVGPEETSNLACRELRSDGGIGGRRRGKERGGVTCHEEWKSM